jgi:hypothetical protein
MASKDKRHPRFYDLLALIALLATGLVLAALDTEAAVISALTVAVSGLFMTWMSKGRPAGTDNDTGKDDDSRDDKPG